jgi:hypothetical protein
VGRKKIAKAPVKKMSFEVSRGVLTDKLQNIKQLIELMKGDEISKDNKYLMNPKAKVLRALKAMEAAAPFINPKIETSKKLDKKWKKEEVPEYFGSSWDSIKAFAKRYKISNQDIMKYMASRVIDRTTENTKRLSAVLKSIPTNKKSLRTNIINNKNKFIKIDNSLKQNETEDDTIYQERLYQAVYKAKLRAKK